jgi:hypothetical protein
MSLHKQESQSDNLSWQVNKQQETINDILNKQDTHAEEISTLASIVNQQHINTNKLADKLITVQGLVTSIHTLLNETVTHLKQKITTKECMALISNLEKLQQTQLELHQNSIQHLTTQLRLSEFDTKHEEYETQNNEISFLTEQINLIQKKQKENSISINDKINARKCIELNTNIGRQQQKQMKDHQEDLQSLTTQLSEISSNQKHNSSLIQTKIDSHACNQIVHASQQILQDKAQKYEEQTNNTITNLITTQKTST